MPHFIFLLLYGYPAFGRFPVLIDLLAQLSGAGFLGRQK
jgi:hypothetical protein